MHPVTNIIAYDKPGDDGLSDIHVMRPDATGKSCVTCATAALPSGHVGNPAWLPSGSYIAFQAQDPALVLPAHLQPYASIVVSVGWGTHHNIWIGSADGVQAWQITRVTDGMGTLHPQFDATGNRLAWAEKIGYTGASERWTIKVADLVWQGGVPSVANVVSYAPLGNDVFYETHSFTPDGAGVLFSAGNPATSDLDIYTYDLVTGQLRNLTSSPGEYDEHAHFSPDGTKIMWASSRGVGIPRPYFVPYTDYWSMNTDGTNVMRVTYFNQPGASEYYAGGVVAADFSFSANPLWFVSKVELIPPGAVNVMELVLAVKLKP